VGQYLVGLWWVTGFNVGGYAGLVVHGAACTALAGALVPVRRRWSGVLALPSALIATEWIRGHFPFGGLPIGGIAIGQAAGPLVPAARLGGSLLVAGVAALAGVSLAELARWVRDRRETRAGWQGAVALIVVVAVCVAGRIGPDGGGTTVAPLRVAVVQGGGPRGLHAVESDPRVVFQRQLDASAALQGPLDLVLWPEDVIQVPGPVARTEEGAQVRALAIRLHATVVAGVVEDQGPDHFRNAAVAWTPSGSIVARYDKVHRVPFGEYVPYRGLFSHLADLSLVPRDAIPGHGSGLLPTAAGRLGVVLSYEVFFQGRNRSAIRSGGQVLLVPTNASSYRISQVPTQEVAAAKLAAWETGRNTLQAAPTGYSALIDSRGRVLARSVLGRREVLVGSVQARLGQTIFVRFGDLPVLSLALLALIAAHWPRREARRT
jgi:apolipoprotein N-acyltransferase